MSGESDNLEVCLVGLGARTSVGASAAASAAAVRAAVSMFAEHPFVIARSGQPIIVARDLCQGEEVVGVDRYLGLAIPAVREALGPLSKLAGREVAISPIIGLPAPRPGLPEGLADALRTRLASVISEGFRCRDITFYAAGHSSGLMAIEESWRRIRSGAALFCLVGGIDSYVLPETLEWLDETERLHSEENAWGLIPGEAAAFCLACSRETADRHHLDVVATIQGAGTAVERVTFDRTEEVCLGEGLIEAFSRALDALPSRTDRVDSMVCDMNGEPYRSDEFGYCVVRHSQRFVDPSDFLTPADCWGDVGAASGPLFASLVATAGRKGYARGPLNLIWTSSDKGERSAALVRCERQTGG
jgi:3-oxoacyl-[acyl-carrier-protein] synthase-1